MVGNILESHSDGEEQVPTRFITISDKKASKVKNVSKIRKFLKDIDSMSTISNESIMSDLSSNTSPEEIKHNPIPLEIYRNKIDSGKRSIQKEKRYVRSVIVKKILQELDTASSNQESGSTGSSTRKNSDNRQEQDKVLSKNSKRQNYSCLSSHGSSTRINEEENQFYWNRAATNKRRFVPTKKKHEFVFK